MNLEELELFRASGCSDGTCEPGTKEVTDDEVFDDTATTSAKLLDDCVEKVFRYMFGKEWEHQVKEKTRKRVRKVISDTLQLEVVEQTENDLGETLDLLEDSLFMLERIMARHSHQQMSVEMVNHMESVADHLEQWGMGDAKKAEKRHTEIVTDRFRD